MQQNKKVAIKNRVIKNSFVCIFRNGVRFRENLTGPEREIKNENHTKIKRKRIIQKDHTKNTKIRYIALAFQFAFRFSSLNLLECEQSANFTETLEA